MLSKNLLYTALTRAESLAILIGTKRMLNITVKKVDVSKRETGLKEQIEAIVGNYNTSSANVMLTNRIDNDSKNMYTNKLLTRNGIFLELSGDAATPSATERKIISYS